MATKKPAPTTTSKKPEAKASTATQSPALPATAVRKPSRATTKGSTSTKAAPKAATPARKVAPSAKAPAVAKAEKVKKPKMVRDSFTFPKTEYAVLDTLKLRALKLGHPVKKTELLRAGIKALAMLSDTAFVSAVRAVPSLKTGRPAKVKAD
jgi:hypothetical protein